MPELSERSELITTVACTTTASPDTLTIEVHHDWAPNGAQRFVDLVKDDFFTHVALFRCVKNFLVQFGVSPDAYSPKKVHWRAQGSVKDDPSQGRAFKRGMLSFAGGGPNTRTTQLFITYADLAHLGKPQAPWEVPIGVVTHGMESVVDKFYQGYGDQLPFNKNGIDQVKLQQRGNSYLRENFPKISYFRECHVVSEAERPVSGEVDQAQPKVKAGADEAQSKKPKAKVEKSQLKPKDRAEKVPRKPKPKGGVDKAQAKAKSKAGADDDGLWAVPQGGGKGKGKGKQWEEEWVAHAQWLHHESKLPQPREQRVPSAVAGDSRGDTLSASEAVGGDRLEGFRVEGIESPPSYFFVLLVLALGAVFLVWKKTKRIQRRDS